MNLVDNDHAHERVFGPGGTPLWYVTNGHAVVGPVDTDLLLRGITSARIPNDCMVAQESWSTWRSLDQIREVSRLRRSFSWSEGDTDLCPGIPEEFVQRAKDAGEALLFAMHAAVTATRATAGLVHRVREPFVGLVTSAVLGACMDHQLGQVVPKSDPALALAENGASFLCSMDETGGAPAGGAIARRFSACEGQLRGVAMAPVFDGDRLLAMIELARADHPFRHEDAAVLSKIARVVCLR